MLSLVSYNPLNKNPQRITKVGKKWLIILINFKGIEFPVSKKYYRKIELKNYIFVNVFCYENGLTYLIHTSKQKFEDCMDLLLFNDENKSHYIYIYIKVFNKFMFNKTNCKNKKHFYRYCLQCFSSKRFLLEQKETCLRINGKQIVKLDSGITKF